MLMFNLLLTFLHVISLGVLGQDVSFHSCLEVFLQNNQISNLCIVGILSLLRSLLHVQFPGIYQQGQKGISFSWRQILGWMGNGILTSLLIFTLSVQILSDSAFRHGGEVADISHLGVFMYTMIIWTVICQIALITIHFTTWIQNMLICGSVLCWYIVSCGPCTHPHC